MKLFRLLISGFWLSIAVLIIVIGLMFSAARLLLPEAGQYRKEVAAWVGKELGQPVRIGALGASWHGWRPSVELRDLTVLDAAGEHVVLQCAAALIDLDVWASLRERQFEPGRLTVRGVRVALLRRADGGIGVMGLGDNNPAGMDEQSEEKLKQWLQRQDRLAIEDSSLQWRDPTAEGRTLEFTAVNLQLRNHNARHRLDGTVDLPEALGTHLEVALDVQGDLFTPASWQGQLFGRGAAIRLGEWWGKQPRFGVAAADGVADFQVWSDWRNGVQQIEGDIHAHSLHVTRETESSAGVATAAAEPGQADIESLDGGFHWQRRNGGWIVDVDNFSIARQGVPAPPAQLRVEYTEDQAAGRRVIRSAYSELRVADIADLLLAARMVPADFRERLVALAPQGSLHDGYLSYESEPQQAPRFVLHTQFSGLAFQPAVTWPGAQGLTGAVTASGEQGVITLATQKAAVDFANLFRAPIPVEALAGKIYWRHDDSGLQVLARDVTARNEDVKLQLGARLDVPPAGGSPYLDMSSSFGEGNGEHVSRYLPAKIMPPATVAWLDKAIVGGRVSGGTARIYGRLADFPFDKGQGLFEIRFNVADGILEYGAGWPRLEKIATEIAFRGRGFEAHAASAVSLASEVLQARVTIPDMTAQPAVLTVEGKAQGPTADAVRYVTQSPLHDKFGAYLDDITVGGRSRLQLSLSLPLAKLPARVKGALQIAGGSLSFHEARVDFNHINGTLNFTERGLAARDIHADLLGQALTIAAKTKPDSTGPVTTFSALGTADTAALTKRFASALVPYVGGSAAWRGELRIPPKSQGWVELEVGSSLQGVEVRLPSPLGKGADSVRNLLVQIPLPLKGEKPVHIRYGDIADTQLLLMNGATGMEAVRGEVRFGPGTAVLPAQGGIRLVGSLPEFDQAQWRPILWPEAPNAPAAAVPLITQVDMELGALKLFGGQLDAVRLKMRRGDNAWDADLKSDQAAGRIRVPDADDAPLTMDMERLYWPRLKNKAGESPPDPRKIHPLRIDVKSFHYGDLDLGALHVKAGRDPAGLVFEELSALAPQQKLSATGRWEIANGQQQSSFAVVYDGEDVGNTLTALGFAGMIQGGRTHTDIKLKWPGSPAAFALAKSTGSIGFEIKEGRLLDVEPGAGRILGLLSFQALPRRLVLDFSDLFQKGFAFDSLAGSFSIENGDAQTDNLRMEGPAARIEARGRVGLAAEDYDQRVTVIPNVSAGLPVAGALAGGVGAGAALLLMENVLKPGIDKITRVEYQVTGPWTNPAVERVTAAGQEKKPEGKNNNE